MSTERTFEEIIADTNQSIDNIIMIGKYWKERCLAAEDFIEKSPGDPDITKEQIIAHDWWQLHKKAIPPCITNAIEQPKNAETQAP